MSERVTVPECGCAASKFIGGRWVSMAEVTVGETTGTGVVHDAHSCWRCGQELTAAGQARDVVPRVETEAVRGSEFFALLARAVSKYPIDDHFYVACESREWAVILAALSQSTGLAAAEWLARRLGEEFDCPVCALPLLPPDDGDLDEHMAKRNAACQHRGCDTAGNCHSAPEEGWQCWLSAALAAVGAPTPERADGPEPSDTELLDALNTWLLQNQWRYVRAISHGLLEAAWGGGHVVASACNIRALLRAILAARQPTPTGDGDRTCTYCGGEDCDCDQRREEAD